MSIDVGRSILIIAVCALCTFLERYLPFAVFGGREVPSLVKYLGKILPMAVIAALVIYCLRGTAFSSLSGFVPQLVAVAVTVLLHLWRGSTLLSVAGGTAAYMLFVQAIFRV